MCVCLGNICRSPVAEAAIRRAASELGVDVVVDSAGLGPWQVGSPPHPLSRQAAAEVGLELTGSARQIRTTADLEGWDLIVAMDRSNLNHILDIDPDAPAVLLRSFDPNAGDDETPDPYGLDLDAYRQMVAMIEPAARALVAEISRR